MIGGRRKRRRRNRWCHWQGGFIVYPDYYYPSLVLLQSINRDGNKRRYTRQATTSLPAWSKSSESSLCGQGLAHRLLPAHAPAHRRHKARHQSLMHIDACTAASSMIRTHNYCNQSICTSHTHKHTPRRPHSRLAYTSSHGY